VVATITNVRSTCSSGTDPIQATATFDVLARRSVAGPAREVVLPYFTAIVRGGTVISSKQVGRWRCAFADGQIRAQTSGSGSAAIQMSAATLPAEVQEKITRRRKPTDADASIDPMTDPATRSASCGELRMLVGFQLTPEQLRYNATR
jgi:hypothetical protein